MNKKNKVLLSTIGLVLLSGIAATGSTFAWFTSVRTASINFNDATVETKSGNLVIAYRSTGDDGGLTNSLVGNVLTLGGSNKITDVSGDGVNFYKPVWADSASTTASVINTVTTSVGHYIEFGITVSRSNAASANGLKVYIGTGTSIVGKDVVEATPGSPTPQETAQQALNDSVVAATRLAVVDASNAVKFRYAPVAETSPEYLTLGTGTAYGLTTHALTADSSLITGTFPTDLTVIPGSASDYEVADLTGATTTADLTFRVWIEGTDDQTINDIIGGVISVNVALYALEVVA
ncbi:MAG: hypothetical protein WC968_02705 [Bacilli bacterium]